LQVEASGRGRSRIQRSSAIPQINLSFIPDSRNEVKEPDSACGNDGLGLEESWRSEGELGELPLPKDEDGEENDSKLFEKERVRRRLTGTEALKLGTHDNHDDPVREM